MVKTPIKIVTWDEVCEWTYKLAQKIAESGWTPNTIVAIARGGYAPARLLCDYLGINELVSIQIVHWPSTAEVAERAYVKYQPPPGLDGKRILIVDDIVDTGDSIILAREYIERNYKDVEVRTAAMQWISSVAKIKPDYWVIEVKDWTWFVYPWNVTEDMTNFIRKILIEEAKGGRTELSLGELLERLVEWYGDEILKVKIAYLHQALRLLEAKGVVKRMIRNGIEIIRLIQ